MTWGEFKKKVEEAGVKDKDEIDVIDISRYTLEFLKVTSPDGKDRWQILG